MTTRVTGSPPQSTSTPDAPSPQGFSWTSRAPEATHAAASGLAAGLDAEGLVLALVGSLGAGKTLFVQGLADGLGVDPARVTSPTFVIAGEYEASGERRLHHLDLYRVGSVAELEQTGFLDMLERGAIVAVEWADRFAQELPRDRVTLEIERREQAEEGARRFRARAGGPSALSVLTRWYARLGECEGVDRGEWE